MYYADNKDLVPLLYFAQNQDFGQPIVRPTVAPKSEAKSSLGTQSTQRSQSESSDSYFCNNCR